MGGKRPLAASGRASVCPWRMTRRASAKAPARTTLLRTFSTSSSPATMPSPLASSVPKVREKRATIMVR